MINFMMRHPEKLTEPLITHIRLVSVTMVISVLLAAVLTVVAIRWEKTADVILHLFSVIYSVPSLALFALLIPVTGLGTVSAVIVLTIYNQYLLIRNFLTGIREVEPSVVEAAVGIGMTQMQVLWKVQLPLAKKAVFAGIRLAVVSTIGIGTIASCINAGGLGVLLFDGLRSMNVSKILWGSILSASLAILVNTILKALENRVSRSIFIK